MSDTSDPSVLRNRLLAAYRQEGVTEEMLFGQGSLPDETEGFNENFVLGPATLPIAVGTNNVAFGWAAFPLTGRDTPA